MKPVPIYRSDGEWVAMVAGLYLYNRSGEWIGWREGREVYSRDGEYVGYLSDDQRVLRKRVRQQRPLRELPSPLPPLRIRVPSSVPLAPMFSELRWEVLDVFEENPDVFEFVSELKPDWEG